RVISRRGGVRLERSYPATAVVSSSPFASSCVITERRESRLGKQGEETRMKTFRNWIVGLGLVAVAGMTPLAAQTAETSTDSALQAEVEALKQRLRQMEELLREKLGLDEKEAGTATAAPETPAVEAAAVP